MGAVEANAAWWMSERRFKQLKIKIEGFEHFQEASKQGGVILCGFHFHTLELSGRAMGGLIYPSALVYQRHPNPLFDAFLMSRRRGYATAVFRRQELKAMIQWLRAGKGVWYAPDQDFGRNPSVFVPFFGIQTATLTAPSRIAESGGAKLVPFFCARVGLGEYHIQVLPALNDYPSGDESADALRLNQVLEEKVREYPEQYLWQHRRFKTRPDHEANFYE